VNSSARGSFMHDNTLLVVDGMAAVYRAFYAIKNLRTSDGRPSNAIFGFIRMMDQLVKAWSPSHLVVAFDGGLPAERMELIPEYKANRSPMPDDLRLQLDGINEYLAAAEVPTVRLNACEADDVMATLAVRAAGSSTRVLLATHDKDLFQLVNENTEIVPVTGRREFMGPDEIVAKTGVMPEQIVDWLALIGDSADNIKGVPGVGPKTATKLLTAYGCIDGIWPHLDDIQGAKLKESLAESREIILRNQKMVKLYTDLEGIPDWKNFSVTAGSVEKLLQFYDKFELHDFARSLREPELF
jgi:DNA polymerase-1